MESCPIYHDVDSQSIYGFDIIQHSLRKSEEVLWKDCEFEIFQSLKLKVFFPVDYKFQPPPRKPSPTGHAPPINRQRSGSADYTAQDATEITFTRQKRWFESDSVVSINLGSSLKIFHEEERKAPKAGSRLNIFDSERGFLGRRASLMKFSLMQRRNTVA